MSTTNQDVGMEWDTGNFQIVPPGYYRAVVKSADAKQSQAGNDMVVLVMSIEDNEFDGVTIYYYMVFASDKPANDFTNVKRQAFQKSAGLEYSMNDSNDVVAKMMTNKKVTIKVKTGKNQDGKEQNEICGVHPYTWNPDQNLEIEPPDMDENFL
jgi:hypothetical protein